MYMFASKLNPPEDDDEKINPTTINLPFLF